MHPHQFHCALKSWVGKSVLYFGIFLWSKLMDKLCYRNSNTTSPPEQIELHSLKDPLDLPNSQESVQDKSSDNAPNSSLLTPKLSRMLET